MWHRRYILLSVVMVRDMNLPIPYYICILWQDKKHRISDVGCSLLQIWLNPNQTALKGFHQIASLRTHKQPCLGIRKPWSKFWVWGEILLARILLLLSILNVASIREARARAVVICIHVVIAYDMVLNWDRQDISDATRAPARCARQRYCRTRRWSSRLGKGWSSACGVAIFCVDSSLSQDLKVGEHLCWNFPIFSQVIVVFGVQCWRLIHPDDVPQNWQQEGAEEKQKLLCMNCNIKKSGPKKSTDNFLIGGANLPSRSGDWVVCLWTSANQDCLVSLNRQIILSG